MIARLKLKPKPVERADINRAHDIVDALYASKAISKATFCGPELHHDIYEIMLMHSPIDGPLADCLISSLERSGYIERQAIRPGALRDAYVAAIRSSVGET